VNKFCYVFTCGPVSEVFLLF